MGRRLKHQLLYITCLIRNQGPQAHPASRAPVGNQAIQPARRPTKHQAIQPILEKLAGWIVDKSAGLLPSVNIPPQHLVKFAIATEYVTCLAEKALLRLYLAYLSTSELSELSLLARSANERRPISSLGSLNWLKS